VQRHVKPFVLFLSAYATLTIIVQCNTTVATGVGGKFTHLQNGVFVEALAQHGALLGGVVAPADGTSRSHAVFW
jgi:hypothetical protein